MTACVKACMSSLIALTPALPIGILLLAPCLKYATRTAAQARHSGSGHHSHSASHVYSQYAIAEDNTSTTENKCHRIIDHREWEQEGPGREKHHGIFHLSVGKTMQPLCRLTILTADLSLCLCLSSFSLCRRLIILPNCRPLLISHTHSFCNTTNGELLLPLKPLFTAFSSWFCI